MKNERKEELKDEMKNRISLALKDPILQQGFEIICKNLAELEKENKTVSRKANKAIADKLLITAKYNEVLNDLNQENDKVQKENAELKEIIDNDVDKKIYVQLAKKAELADVQKEQLTTAKEIIKDLLSLCEGETDSKLVFTRAEQFLNGEGCTDCLCEDCTKDCEIKKLGLVEVEK